MKTRALPYLLALSLLVTFRQSALGQWSTPPASTAETEKFYTDAIEKRTADILAVLQIPDAEKCMKVHDIIIAQYRALRARDAAIDSLLRVVGKDATYSNRAMLLEGECKPMHDRFIEKLSALLTPDQLDKVKDKMTYNKVKVTYDAYCAIVPNLTDAEKAKILDELKAAREEAIDGGSAPEKSEIFQKYKNEINSYLTANGHDVTNALQNWSAKQEEAKKSASNAAPSDAAK